ncbi:hypothetical protein CAPTEDRAFT_195188 [Capitella teleta]|uniref:CSC1/OSCA1-like 7TM region domain-containing protein n=1 Tax=Capitella teleta TaxID=283909 RepID=R7UEQ0_CAPTE|nr:hypothetical protein CAPTEDRAFT_195188 [Capitella teleta]|eukprot:ELU01757.1 hypothetical protein CAPTEDRAFT_195188 [Capitella teleta]
MTTVLPFFVTTEEETPSFPLTEEYSTTESPTVPLTCIRKYFINNSTKKAYLIYEGYSGIPENLTISIIVWVVLFTAFIVIRRTVYGKFRGYTEDTLKDDSCNDCFNAYLGWIPFLFRLKYQQFSQKCGPDAVLYLQFQSHIITYMSIVTLISLAVILPVNFHGDLIADPNNFAKTTIANVDPDSALLWVHTIVALLYLVLAFFIMKSIKTKYLASRKEDLKTRTLLFTNLKASPSAEKMLIEFFRRYSRGEKERERYHDTMLESFNYAYDVNGISKVFEERQRVHQLRQHAERMINAGQREHMWTHTLGCCCLCCWENGWACGPNQMDCLEYYREEEKHLTIKYQRLLARTLSAPLDVAFVTFSSEQMCRRVYAHMARMKHCRQRCVQLACYPGGTLDVRRCAVYYAPEPEDVNWQNLSHSRCFWWFKAVIVNVILCMILFIFTTPSVIMNLLDELRYRKALEALNSPALVNIVPVFLLLLFSSLLPAVVYLSESLIGHWTKSKEHKLIMMKSFVFLLLMILILPSLGLTSARALVQWLADRDQGSIMRWDCIFLPDNGAFFVNYLVAAAFIGTSMQLLGVWRLICLTWRLVVAKSSMERSRAWSLATEEYFNYGLQYAWYLVLFCTMISYSVCVPLITPFGLVYLVLKHFVDRHNIYYTTRPSRMSSEPHFRAVNFVNTGVVLLQFFIIAFSMLRKHGMPPPPAIFTCIILVTTLIYLTGKSIYNYIAAGLKYFVDRGDEEENISSTTNYVYYPEVILWGANQEELKNSIAPRPRTEQI